MDGHSEHSDSDSGDSWTLLDHSVAYADEAPEFPDGLEKQESEIVGNTDRDEDTDGISIISDSDAELLFPQETENLENNLEDRPADSSIPEYILVNQSAPNIQNDHGSLEDDPLLADNSGKLRTYVHRRNKRLSTMLNIIVLGSIITAAGVAIGHMWGVRDDCSMHSTQSINKILSNLYKLQEENAYLRSKIRELTQSVNFQEQIRKPQRCRKIFEEPLTNKNIDKLTKCVDMANNLDSTLQSHLEQPEFETQFLNDLSKLKHVYKQNKSWLDEEVAKRLKTEKYSTKKLKNKLKIEKNNRTLKPDNFKTQAKLILEDNRNEIKIAAPGVDEKEKRLSYADSLKQKIDETKLKTKENSNVTASENNKGLKRKLQRQENVQTEPSESEEDLRKDDRYVRNKHRHDKKKHNRQKLREKRRNKYEQWEMKGGYMKDYDDISTTSSQENEFVLKNPDNNFQSQEFESLNYVEQFSDADSRKNNKKSEKEKKVKQKSKGYKDKTPDWYEKRAVVRSEARKKLEKELFGDNTSTTASWYFRRMQRREQCRVKGETGTHKKTTKKAMNFKTKR